MGVGGQLPVFGQGRGTRGVEAEYDRPPQPPHNMPLRFQLPNQSHPPSTYSSSSWLWFGGLFSGKEEEPNPKVKTKVQENFDSLAPSSFEFK